MKVEGIELNNRKGKKEEKVCVMIVTVDTIATTNTSLKTDKAKSDVFKIPGVRKKEHEAECTVFYTTIKKTVRLHKWYSQCVCCQRY